MSDLINHFYCGEEALKLLNPEIKKIIEDNRTLFNLGTQGPDFFLYHDIIPWRKHYGYSKFGGMLHSYEPNLIFSTILEYINFIEDKDEKDKAIAYVMGYICHHSLDSISHPYIHYYSGQDSNLHKEFEKNLDVLNSSFMNKLPAVYFSFSKAFDLNESEKVIVEKINYYLIDKLFNFKLPFDAISLCLKDFNYLIFFFQDKNGIKQKIFKPLETLIGKPFAITKALIHSDIDDKDDYMNLKHSTWLHPCDENIKSTESYPDLFNKSIKDSANKINELSDILNNNSFNKIPEIIKNSSFQTGEVHKYINHINTSVLKYSSVKKF